MSSPQSKKVEEQIRIAMALNRGTEWLGEIEKTAKSDTRSDYAALKLGYLENLFHETHQKLFQDWNGNGESVDGKKRLEIRKIIEDVFFRKEEGGRLFDKNGFVVRFEPEETAREQFAKKLASFYEKMRAFEPYSFGNKLTLDFFMVALAKLPAVDEVYPEGIDFRRLSKDDLVAMAKNPPEHKAVVAAFMNATDVTRIHPLMNHYHKSEDGKGYSVWNDKTLYIGGIPFLSHEEDGIKYLVTMNGGLVELDKVQSKLEDFFKGNNFIANFETFKAEKYLAAPSSLGEKAQKELQEKLDALKISKEISGVKMENDAAPLVCLDINIMSGLRPTSNEQLLEFLKKTNKLIFSDDGKEKEAGKITITDLYNKPEANQNKEQFLAPFFEKADKNDRLHEMLNIAYDRVNANMAQIKTEVKKKFEGKTTEQKNPKMYMSMGGAGSGKSVVEEIIKAEVGGDFVVSALDSFREHNDINTLLLAAEHHADDYAIVDPYAQELRKLVIDEAIEKKVNILCDGSGIDYKGRNDKTVKKFKDADFKTQLVAVELNYPEAVSRVNGRFIRNNRAMPWCRVADKHINFAPSFLDAVADKNLDKISLIATDLVKGEQYLVAETFDKIKDEVQSLEKEINSGIADIIKGFFHDITSVVNVLWKADQKEVQNLAEIPNFTDVNSTFIKYPNGGKGGADRVLAVASGSRLAGLLEKGLFNQYANSPDAEVLHHTRNDLPFYMPMLSEKNSANLNNVGGWQLRLQNDPSKEAVAARG